MGDKKVITMLKPEEVARGCPVKKKCLRKLQEIRLRPPTLLKKRPWHRWFPVNFAKFLRTPFLKSILGGYFFQTLRLASTTIHKHYNDETTFYVY